MPGIDLMHGVCQTPGCNGVLTRPGHCPLCDIRQDKVCVDCVTAKFRESALRHDISLAHKAIQKLRTQVAILIWCVIALVWVWILA